MKRDGIVTGLILGVLTSVPVILMIYAADKVAGLPFAPFDVFDFLVRVLPGFIIIPGIHLMSEMLLAFHVASLSSAAKTAEQAMAVCMFVGAGGVTGGILGLVAAIRQGRNLPVAGMLTGLAATVAMAGVLWFVGFPSVGAVWSILWLGVLFVAWGSTIGWLLDRMLFAPAETPPDLVAHRRARHLHGTLAVAVLAAVTGLAVVVFSREAPQTSDAENMSIAAVSVAALTGDASDSRIEPAPGTRPEVTPINDFYRIDINTRPPEIDASEWRLEVTGLVDRPLSLSLDDIRALAPVSQYATMSCISNPIGGPLISTGLWTGVPLITVLDLAGLKPSATKLYVQAADGFYETVVARDMNDPRTLLVYELNGEPLNAEQGFPLRFFIINRYGMKQPKWITSIEALDDNGRGFWVDRGWDNDAIVQTTSVIDVVATDHPDPVTGAIQIGGIAYSGSRGISKVEVQIDDGPWMEAQLRTPPLSPLTWVQWRYDWMPVPGRHTARVRAYESSGVMQTAEENDVFPRGATGYHEVTFRY